MDVIGIEPTTSSALFGSEMRLRQNVGDCPSSIKKAPLTRSFLNGGRDRDRTDDLLVANEALSQLSYTPENCLGFLVWELLRTYLL